jgi:DNA (cytosine-5)-methyltransferase 1
MSTEHICDRCGKTFEKKQGLTQHMKRKTPCDNKKENPMRIVSEENEVGSREPYKFIDLFCGIGGFHIALTELGCECVLACDIDNACREIYNENFGIMPVKDIRELDPDTMEDFDIICGGFPCQPFSNGGKKRTFEDDRGLLFDEIMRLVRTKKPKYMFLENVKHILKVSNGEVIEYIKQKISDAGYHLQIFIMSPHNYGIPQQRERVYFVCVRKDLCEKQEMELPENFETIKLERFMQKKEEVDEKYFVKGDVLDVLNAWDEMVKKMDVGEKLSPTILIHDAYRNHSEEYIAMFPEWKRDYIKKNENLIQKYKKEFGSWYDTYKSLLQKREIYGKLEWQVGLVKENETIFNHFIQMRQSGIRVKKAQYFPTLVAIAQIPIYGRERRYITPRECARLQCFPDSFKIHPNDKCSYKQFGNSVNVLNVKTVVETAMKYYG